MKCNAYALRAVPAALAIALYAGTANAGRFALIEQSAKGLGNAEQCPVFFVNLA